MAAQGNNSGQAKDIDQWVSSLEEILECVPQYMCTPGHPGRISRIPEILREVDAKSYEPYFLSIGPYHHGKSKLQNMEKGKLDILKYLLEQRAELTLKDYLKEIKSIEPEARSFYSDVQMDSEVFVRMLLLDSLCLLTSFCGMPKCQKRTNNTSMGSLSNRDNVEKNETMNSITEAKRNTEDTERMQMITRDDELNNGRSGEHHVDAPRWLWSLFVHDVFLLENQIPFFVLEKVHELTYGDSGTSLIDSLKYEFSKILWEYTRLDSDKVISPTDKPHHLLHFCHMFFLPTLQQEPSSCQLNEANQMFRLDSAMQLHKSGVSFEATSAMTEHGLLDITFTNSGKISMPCLCVDDNTESLLRNLIALEQMKYPNIGLNVSAYAVLLLHLITVPDDVELLRRKGIIYHHLPSDKEMVHFINKLSKGLAFDYMEDDYSLKPVFQELKSYSNCRVPRWKAWLNHRYFKNPWTGISIVAAMLLLLLCAVQTFYTVYPFYHPYFSNP